jgi:hypothetical protein
MLVASKSPKGCSRVDYDITNAHGWLVRIKRGETRLSKFFSDSTFGGKAKSMKAAKECYEKWVSELPPPDTSAGKLTSRNTSGVVGVHYSHDVDSRYPGCQYESYIASWLDSDGRRRNMRFSVNKYGKKGAFDLAVIARDNRVESRDEAVALLEKNKGSGKAAPKSAGKAATKASPKAAAKGTKKAKKAAKKK